MNQSFTPDGLQFAWDSTSITLAETCLRKYQYKMIEGWQSQGLSVHLRFGQHYATALEHYYKRLALGEGAEDALIGIVEEAMVDTWDYPTCEKCLGSGSMDPGDNSPAMVECVACGGTGHALEGGQPWDSLHNLKNRENLIRSIIWYIDHFEQDPAPIVMLSDGAPAVEYTFRMPVDNDLIFSGHLDRLVTYADNPFVMDQKTTTQTLSAYYFEQFKPNTQMSMYSMAGNALLGSPVKGVIIDAAQVAVGFTKFGRDFTYRTTQEIEEWYDTAMYHIEAAREATKENYFPMRPASCGNYGGCEFRRICSKSPEFRQQFLESNFEKGERWDPLKVR